MSVTWHLLLISRARIEYPYLINTRQRNGGCIIRRLGEVPTSLYLFNIRHRKALLEHWLQYNACRENGDALPNHPHSFSEHFTLQIHLSKYSFIQIHFIVIQQECTVLYSGIDASFSRLHVILRRVIPTFCTWVQMTPGYHVCGHIWFLWI